jgi:DNA primase
MVNFIPEDVIQEVIQRTDIINLVSQYVKLQKRGKNYIGLCPFHNEKTPSFCVSPEKKLFHCFGCGEGGNAISFLMKIENLAFKEAVETLAEREGIRLSITNTDKGNNQFNKSLYSVNNIAQKFYHHLLCNYSHADIARNYFKKRGLTKEIIDKFGLGYSPNSWEALYKFLKKKGVHQDVIEKAGLIVKKENKKIYDRFRNRLMFPIYDWKGTVVGFGGRQIDEDDRGPKYLNSPETDVFHKNKILYGLNWGINEIRRKNYVFVVEGYMDVIAFHQYGFNNTVASLGTSFTEEQAKLLKRYCSEVIVAYDGDLAGTEATLRGINILQKEGCKIKILNFPEGSDPDEYIRENGKNEFLRYLENNIFNLIDYKLKIAVEKFSIDAPEGKAKALNFLLDDLVFINNAVEKQHYFEKIITKLQINENALYEEYNKARRLQKYGIKQDKNNNKRNNTNKLIKDTLNLTKSEKILIKNMLEDEKIFNKVYKEIGFEYFDEQIKNILLLYQEDLQIMNKTLTPALFINKLEGDLKSCVSSILAMEENVLVSFDDCFKDVKLKHLKKQEHELISEIEKAEKIGNTNVVASLIQHLKELQKKIQILKSNRKSNI